MQNKHKTISVRRYINTFLIVASILVSILHLFVFVESFLYFDMADEATIVCVVAGLNLIVSFFDATTRIAQTPASEVPKNLQGIRMFFIVLNRCKMLICHDVSSLRIIAPAMAHIFLQQLLQTIDERVDFILCANQRGKESQSMQAGCIQKQALAQCIDGDLRGIKTFC